MSTIRDQYKLLVEKRNEINSFSEIEALLQWDQTVNMPAKGNAKRGLQCAAISGVSHDLKTSSELGAIIKKLEEANYASSADLTDMEKATVRDSKRDYEMETVIPRELATDIAKLSADAYEAWVTARQKNDFSIFQPKLADWVNISRKKAELMSKIEGNEKKSLYEVLMDQFERGLTCEKLDKVFGEVRTHLVPLIKEIAGKPKPDTSFLKHEFDATVQSKVSFQISKDMGFDLERGRMDVSVHPFTTTIGAAEDVRITSKYKPDDLSMGLGATIHETGHALYEQGLPAEFASLPSGKAVSMGIHESQSLFWERMVGQGEHFWKKYFPLLQESFSQIPRDKTPTDFYNAYNIVEPGLIRVEADELTYPLHIILRYEIESGLISGDIKVDENLPKLWNQKMQDYLGITPQNDKEGILQDIHWSSGAFGYFPTYTLGAIYASQFYKTAKEKIPGLEQQIAQGNFAELKKWLNENIHSKGSLYPTGDQLCKLVTGEELNAGAFVQYLKEKYSKLYNL